MPDLLTPNFSTPAWQEIAYGEADHDLLGPVYRDVSINTTTAITEAAAQLVTRFAYGGVNTSFIPSPPFYNGQTCIFEFYAPAWNWQGSGGRQMVFLLWDEDAGSSLGWIGRTNQESTSVTDNTSLYFVRRFAPVQGNHMYSIRAFIQNGTAGTMLIRNGGGGVGNYFPTWARVWEQGTLI